MQIDLNSETLGTLKFVPRIGGAVRTAYGFRLDFPAELTLWKTTTLGLIPVVRNLQAVFSFVPQGGGEVELGTFTSDFIFIGSSQKYTTAASFTWVAPLTVLAEYERLRNGDPPHFRVRVYGDIALQVPGPQPGLVTMTTPQRFLGDDELHYPAELWANCLRSLRLIDIVLLEIPIAENAPAGYETVWQQIRSARDLLMRGGPFAWESCALAVRRALEAWEQVEPAKGSQRQDGKHATKLERLYKLRMSLQYYLGYAAHNQHDDEPAWTREDALLAVTTLCALLTARKP